MNMGDITNSVDLPRHVAPAATARSLAALSEFIMARVLIDFVQQQQLKYSVL